MNPKPFLKYIGSKESELKALKYYFPKNHVHTVIEPFVGGGSVSFWYLKNHKADKAVISDTNKDLINCYLCIKYNYQQLIKDFYYLSQLDGDRLEYYEIRHFFNVWHHYLFRSPLLASIYIWINSTDFNGLIRYDKKGDFNVAYNIRHDPFDFEHKKNIIIADHRALQKVDIHYSDFGKILKMADSNDFVFLDPPYLKPKMFKRYGSVRYANKDAVRLRNQCFRLRSQGIKWLETNADTKQIRSLYSGMNQFPVNVSYLVSPLKLNRGKAKEIIITDYQDHSLNKHRLATGGLYFKIQYRCLDLVMLVKLRRNHRQSINWYRDLLFLYAVNYVHIAPFNDLEDRLYMIDSLFDKPLPSSTINEISTEYNLDHWHYTNTEIIKQLGINHWEQLRMHTLILNKYKSSKINLQRRIKNKRSPAKKNRARRNRKIMSLHNKNIKNNQIAKILNISRNTVSNVINRH